MTDDKQPAWVASLKLKLEQTIEGFNKAGLAEWVELFKNPRRLIMINLASGISRGVGIAIGFTLVSALIVVFLSYLARLNLPIIGEFIANVVRIVDLELRGL